MEDTVHAGCMGRGVGVRSKGDLRLFLYIMRCRPSGVRGSSILMNPSSSYVHTYMYIVPYIFYPVTPSFSLFNLLYPLTQFLLSLSIVIPSGIFTVAGCTVFFFSFFFMGGSTMLHQCGNAVS